MSYSDKQIQIIETAEKLFASRGFDGTSVRDIAEEAKVNLAMISYYFGSKEKLMEAIFAQRTSAITERLERLLNDEKLSSWEKISLLIDDYIERIDEKQQFHKLMFHEQMLEKNTVVTNLLNELKKKNAQLVERLIKEGQQKKVFVNNVDVVFLMSTLFGIVMQTFINRNYYKMYNNLEAMPEEEFKEFLKKKLSDHVKNIFKAILSYEA